jgi:hypothetical protein
MVAFLRNAATTGIVASMPEIFSLCDWIAALLFAGALAMTALTHKEHRAAIIMIWAATALFLVRWGVWAMMTDRPWYIRMTIGALTGGFLFAAIPAAIAWIKAQPTEAAEKDSPPAPDDKKDSLKSKMGNDNTIVGAPIPNQMGDGNTIVGPTDGNGNTLFNKGGTAIGKGACADSTSVAIGSGALAGKCEKSEKSDKPK